MCIILLFELYFSFISHINLNKLTKRGCKLGKRKKNTHYYGALKQCVSLFLFFLFHFQIEEQKMHIVLLRDEDVPTDKYRETFAAHGYPVITQIPALSFSPCNATELCEKSQHLREQHSGVVFTSKRAVDAFSHIIDIHTVEQMNAHNFPVYAVGPACGERIRGMGVLDVEGEECGNAEELSSLIISHKERHTEASLFFPCGNLARETLPKRLEAAGIGVETLCCYTTVANEGLVGSLQEVVGQKGVPDVLVFFSPSSVNFHIEDIERLLVEHGSTTETADDGRMCCKMVCIGRTTESAFLKLGRSVSGVAEKPTPEFLVKAVIKSMHCT